MYLADHARDMPQKPAMIFSDGTRFPLPNSTNGRIGWRSFSTRAGFAGATTSRSSWRTIALFRCRLGRAPFRALHHADQSLSHGRRGAYIANDCGAHAIVSSYARRDVATQLPRHLPAAASG